MSGAALGTHLTAAELKELVHSSKGGFDLVIKLLRHHVVANAEDPSRTTEWWWRNSHIEAKPPGQTKERGDACKSSRKKSKSAQPLQWKSGSPDISTILNSLSATG